MFLSHAADVDLENQDSKTNSENVQFSVYLDENDRSKNQTSKSIVAEDLKLFVAINVQGGGKLENTKIEFSNSNFELKDNSNTFEKNIGTISSENGISFGLPIVARKNSKYNLSLLNMVSTIKLTGEYIDKNGNVTKIDTTKNVKVEWTADEITQEEVELSQEVITNRLYNIEGTNKRIVQVLVKSNIVENKAPVKSTRIEIQEPEIGVKPEQVKVAAKNTLATNGKTNVEFGNLVDSKYEYKQEEGKTYIEILNKVDEENNISWQKNVSDEIIVTYIYNEETEINPFTSKAKSTIELYGRNEAIEKENELALENIETVGDINTLESTVTNNIYKGNMYIGEETSYETAWSVFVSYSKLTNKIMLQDISAEGTEQLSTYYKTTKINKAKVIDLLGEEGIIKVYNAEDLSTPIAEKKLSEETEEYITINYETNVKQIVIETTNAVKEGKLEILNEKSIKVLKAEGIEEISTLTTEVKLAILDETEKAVTTITKSAIANLVEPETTIELNLDKNEISNQTENAVRLTAVLKSVDNSNKLFKNPTINIEFPKEITEVTLDNKSLLYDEELKIKTTEITTNESGNKLLKIELEGEQTKYNTSIAQGGANIVLDLKLKANNFMANKNVEIKTTCINGAENVTKTNNVDIVSKKGILTKNSITIGKNKIEDINNILTTTISKNEEIKINSLIINNNGEKNTNIILTGSIPEGTNLKSALKTNLSSTSIYYANKENPTQEDWIKEVEDYSTIKALKIEVGELEQASEFEIEYILVPTEEGLQEREIFESNAIIDYVVNEDKKQEKLVFKIMNSAKGQAMTIKQTNNVIMSIKSKTMAEVLHEGQIVTYELAITNIGKEILNNTVLNYIIPEGAVYTELTYAQANEIIYTDNTELKNKEWNIESLQPNETITKDITIKINEGAEQIVNKAELKNAEGTVLVEITTEPVNVNKSDISVRLSMRNNFLTVSKEGDKIEYRVIVENISDKVINNLQVVAKIPQNTTFIEDSENWEFNKEDNTICSNIKIIEPKAENSEEKNNIVVLSFKVEVNKFDKSVTSATIQNSVIIKDSNLKEYETNIYTTKITNTRWQINQKSEHNTILKEGEPVKYIIEVKNIGGRADYAYVKDSVPEEIQLQKTRFYIDEALVKEEDVFSNNDLEEVLNLEIGKTLKIEIEGLIYDLEDGVKNKSIKNVAKISLGEEEYLESNEIVNTIVKNISTEDEEDNNGEDVKDNENDKDNADDKVKPKCSISGLAWLDKNKNGIKDNNEEVMQGIEVILLNKDGNPVKNEQEKIITTTTEVTGTYKFNNVPEGEYIVAFIYDSNKYTVTKYQVENAQEDENSDAISKQITIDNETILIGATDTIKVENEDLKNIDIGLIENAKFDLSLEKYVSKVVVTNSTESINYNFGEETLAKVEIAAKRLTGSTVLVQYEIKVSNEGDIQGYASDVIDYMPKELEFNSEMNPDWYLDTNGILHNKTLEKTAIEPGKTQTVSLVLTKTLNSKSTGTIENIAEIGAATNLEQIKDIDSTSANKETGEDDISSASLIISIKTGSPMMYIGVVLVSLLILSIGIYLIDKKVLKGGV